MTGEHQYPEYIARFLRYFELPDSLGVKLPTYEELLTAARAYADDLSRELAILRQAGGLPDVIAQFAREEEEWRKTALLLDDPANRDSQYRKTLITIFYSTTSRCCPPRSATTYRSAPLRARALRLTPESPT